MTRARTKCWLKHSNKKGEDRSVTIMTRIYGDKLASMSLVVKLQRRLGHIMHQMLKKGDNSNTAEDSDWITCTYTTFAYCYFV